VTQPAGTVSVNCSPLSAVRWMLTMASRTTLLSGPSMTLIARERPWRSSGDSDATYSW